MSKNSCNLQASEQNHHSGSIYPIEMPTPVEQSISSAICNQESKDVKNR